jgi:CAAX prenyl protease-like protein
MTESPGKHSPNANTPDAAAASESAATAAGARGREALVARHRWLVFVAPFAVFMAMGMLEPSAASTETVRAGWQLPYAYHPVVYAFRLAATLAAILVVLPGYRPFPFRVRWQSWLFGLVGGVVWIGLCESGWQEQLLSLLGVDGCFGSGGRVAYNPFLQLGAVDAKWPWIYLAIRFSGLVLIVPVIEEFFLRGFLMRFFASHQWWTLPVGALPPAALAVAVIYPVASHPEMLAALVWFSGVTCWVARTRNLWDAVVVHSVTNLLLGVYVVGWDRWRLM